MAFSINIRFLVIFISIPTPASVWSGPRRLYWSCPVDCFSGSYVPEKLLVGSGPVGLLVEIGPYVSGKAFGWKIMSYNLRWIS